MIQPIQPTVKILVNEATFEFTIQQLQQALVDAIPDFCKHEDIEAPTELADMVRTMVVGGASMFMNNLLFFVYGERAPKIPLRADKLPYLTMAVVDIVIGALLNYEVQIHAEEVPDRDGVFRVTSYTAQPLPARPAGAMADCQPCAEAAAAAANAGHGDQRDGGEASGPSRAIIPATAE